MKRLMVIAASTVAFTLLGSTTAFAFWTSAGRASQVTASAATLPKVERPAAELAGRKVIVTWRRTAMMVDAYRVRRHGEGVAGVICARVEERSCTDKAVPVGKWRYTVEPLRGRRWVGPVSDRSGPVTVAGTPERAQQAAPEGPAAPPTQTPTPTPAPTPTPVESDEPTAPPSATS
jgi:hypothetical protein